MEGSFPVEISNSRAVIVPAWKQALLLWLSWENLAANELKSGPTRSCILNEMNV